MFAFRYEGKYAEGSSIATSHPSGRNGWNFYSPEKELARQGVARDKWNFCRMNSKCVQVAPPRRYFFCCLLPVPPHHIDTAPPHHIGTELTA